MKKLASILLAALITAVCFMPTAFADYTNSIQEELNCKALYMICSDNGEVIYAKNETEQRSIASLTKLMTAAVVLKNVEDLEDTVTCSYEAIHSLDGTNSSVAGLYADEELTVKQLLYLLLVGSANDAANVLAEYVGGTIESFVEKMNALSAEIGCTDTHFT
nr:serine hydrolase [Clostridia bacterium]